MVEIRNKYNVLVGIPEGKRPRGRPRRRWKYNNKITGSCEHGNESLGSVKGGELLDQLGGF
jgi:hypothetical protein